LSGGDIGGGSTFSFSGSTAGSSGFILTNPANTFRERSRVRRLRGVHEHGALGNTANGIVINTTNAGQAGLRFDADVDLGARNLNMVSSTFFGPINTQANSGTIGGVVSARARSSRRDRDADAERREHVRRQHDDQLRHAARERNAYQRRSYTVASGAVSPGQDR
jgi:hypothetical protein